jgi:thymidylate synthase
MNNLDKQYQELLQDILDNGVTKSDRTGTGTISVFGRQIRHKMSEGFPLLTTKKMAWKTMVTELLWFLRGDTNIKFLVDNGCHIWDGDAYRNYCERQARQLIKGCTYQEFVEKIKTDDEFAKKWGELGKIYGSQWRSWGKDFKQIPNETGDGVYDITTTGIDQIQNLINDLKTNPDSRRLMVTAWNPSDLPNQVLPPCHYGFQVYTRELSLEERRKLANHDSIVISPITVESWDRNNIPTRAISLMYNARSQDVPLGTPFNLASYGLLLMILAKEVNMVPDELITNMGDCHIYLNQIDGVKEQLTREPFELPTLSMDYREGEYDKELKGFVPDDFVLFNYQSHPSIKMPLSN